MLTRLAAMVLAAASLRACTTYEYEHEVRLNVDGSGTVSVTGRPELWTAFKGLALDPKGNPDAIKRAARELFERSGLDVRRVTLTTRRGHRYLYVAAAFSDVNRISYSPAFPDLRLGLRSENGRLQLDGSWQRPIRERDARNAPAEGLMAVRFHLPSKVYGHRNAAFGVERGNILAWQQGTGAALAGGRLEFGAEMDARSILFSTVMLFAGAVVLAVLLLAVGLWALVRRGRRDLARAGETGPPRRRDV
jgi:hypothetical protein